MNLDQVTLEGAGFPNFKSTYIIDMFPEKLSNEVVGSPLASILSEQRAVTLHFLLLLLLLEICVKKSSTRIGPCERARTQLSEYV